MPVNFNIMNAIQPPQIIGELQNNPSSGGGDDGLGGLLEGIQGLFGGIAGMMGGGSAAAGAMNHSLGNAMQRAPTAAMGAMNNQIRMPSSLPHGAVNQGMLGGVINRGLGQGNPLSGSSRMQQIVADSNPFKTAQSMLGLKENNPVMKQYLQKANPGLDPNVTPWCAGFVGSVLNSSGLKGTNSLAAKSYLDFGSPTKTPTQGDIVVLNRGDNPAFGHVGFFAGFDGRGNVQVLGGNQNNSVSVKSFPMGQVAGFRAPPTGQQVAGFAKQNNITSPEALTHIPNRMGQQYSQVTQRTNPTLQRQYPVNTSFSQPRMQPQQPISQMARPANIVTPNNEVSHITAGIAHVESGGAKNPYGVISKASRNGDRAYGKYQIMGNNIPSWSREALGRPVTREQFIANPEIQDRVAQYHINKYYEKYGNADDVWSSWFSGRPVAKAGNAKDVYGTSVPQYLKKARQGYLASRNRTGSSSQEGINPPSISHEQYEDLTRDIDQDRSYASRPNSQFPWETSPQAQPQTVANSTPLLRTYQPLTSQNMLPEESLDPYMNNDTGINWGLLTAFLQQQSGQADPSQ